MREIVRRAIQARPELTAELLQRGMFGPEEKAAMLPLLSKEGCLKGGVVGPVQFTTLLAEGDAQFAARAVLRKMLGHDELTWLDRLLKFQKPNGKREELARIVERALEGRTRNARSR
jgi:hypothetical protein